MTMSQLLRPFSAEHFARFSPPSTQVLIEGFDPDKFRAANAVKKSSSMDTLGGFDPDKFRAANSNGRIENIMLKRSKSTG